MPKKEGALPDHKILEMMGAEFIKGADVKNINPASLDLTVSGEIYRLEYGLFQPKPGEDIMDCLSRAGFAPHSFEYPLERGVTYLARLNESLALPDGVYGYCNPKSSTGRNDVHVRVLVDGVPRYDAARPHGCYGVMWAAICPKSFPVKLASGEALSQIRFFNANTRFDEFDLQVHMRRDKLIWHNDSPLFYDDLQISDGDGSIILTLAIDEKIIGYECRGSNRVMDFSKRGHYRYGDFFTSLQKSNGALYLKKDCFYILSTREAVRVPPHCACEMVPMDERAGEFRSHYAGFIDPGWGWGENGEGHGRLITLEVRPFEDITVYDNQPIAKVRFEKMMALPDAHYDQLDKSNYTAQIGPKLSKHFLNV